MSQLVSNSVRRLSRLTRNSRRKQMEWQNNCYYISNFFFLTFGAIHYVRYHIEGISLNLHNNLLRTEFLLSLLWLWKSWGSEKWCNFFKDIELISGSAKPWVYHSLTPKIYIPDPYTVFTLLTGKELEAWDQSRWD